MLCFLFIHLCNKQPAKCQAHSSPNKPTLTQGFHEGENNCLFKCFFITSTSNLATHEVCHGERERREDHSFCLQSILHPEKPPSSFAFPTFFSALFCFSTLNQVFENLYFTSEAFTPPLPHTPHFSPLTSLSTATQVFLL